MAPNRRQFLNLFAGASVATLFSSAKKVLPATYPYPISSNVYNWITFYGREQKNWGEDLDVCMAEYVKSGLTAYEPSFNTPAEVVKLGEVLQKYHIAMPSFYVNSVLHKADEAVASIDNIIAIADAAKKLGAKVVVTNPTPIRWGGDEVKSDAELIIQANHLDLLGATLRKKGMILAYHTHDVELKAGAREFHHMLLQTNPQNVSFCFDVHWVYRGSQNSQLAVFDVLKLYGKRVVELHIRQSNNGIWSETLGEGDIDYLRFAQELKRLNLQPNLVIEQCVEDKTPYTMGAVAAHIKDLAAVKQLFKPILG
jgi:inosose dehydratase